MLPAYPRFCFLGFSYPGGSVQEDWGPPQSENLKWEIPEIINSSVLNCVLFWGIRAPLEVQTVKSLPAMQAMQISWRRRFSRILAWRTPWAEEPGGLQSMVLETVPHDWGTETHFLSHTVKSHSPVSPAWGVDHSFVQHILPLSHLETISIIRSTVWYRRCLCSSHPYFTYQWLQSTRVVMLAVWICQRIALKWKPGSEKMKVLNKDRKTITYWGCWDLWSKQIFYLWNCGEKKKFALFCCPISNCKTLTTVHGKALTDGKGIKFVQ